MVTPARLKRGPGNNGRSSTGKKGDIGDARSSILEILEDDDTGTLRRYGKGCVLYRQGDPAESVFLIQSGKVRQFSLSAEGGVHTYEIMGPGSVVGATAVLLDEAYDCVAETLETTDVYVIPRSRFQHILSHNPGICAVVTRQLAEDVRFLASQVRELSFMDVSQRLKHRLTRLAERYGVSNNGGIKMNLDLTHHEIAELVSASRSTVTIQLNELARQGYLWREDGHLVIMRPEHINILDRLTEAVIQGNEEGAIGWAREAVQARVNPVKALGALMNGMHRVDKDFVGERLALPDVAMAAVSMKSAMAVIEEAVGPVGRRASTLGTVVIGTVHGEGHDIGKTMVATLLAARGFKVVDVGTDVAAEEFVSAAKTYEPAILGISGHMTSSLREISKVIAALEREGLRDQVKVLVGGGAITERVAAKLGVDGYERTASEAVALAVRLVAAE